jgi:hypothetical protein
MVGPVLVAGGHVGDDDGIPGYADGEAPGGGLGLVGADTGVADACGAEAEADPPNVKADLPPVVAGRSATESVCVPATPRLLGSIKSRRSSSGKIFGTCTEEPSDDSCRWLNEEPLD